MRERYSRIKGEKLSWEVYCDERNGNKRSNKSGKLAVVQIAWIADWKE